MKIDNLHFIESMFRPQYRERVPVFIQAIVDDDDATSQTIIKQHCRDLAKNQDLQIEPDFEALKKTVKKLRKALRNRVKAFKIISSASFKEEDLLEVEAEDTNIDGEE